MKKAPALITIAIILVAGALIIFFYGNRSKTEITSWQLIGPGTIGVLETDQPATLRKLGIDTTDLIVIINALGKSRKFSDPYLFSFQSTGKQMEWAVILPKGFPSPLDTLKALKKSLNQRTYEGRPLYDLRNGNLSWATFADIGGLWVASRSSLLVEEIVRQSQHPARNFKTTNSALFNLSTVKQDDGNLYLNWSAVASQVSRARGKERTRDLTHSLVLDLKWDDRSLQGNGFAVDTAAFSTLLSTFAEQRPVTFELRKIIPEQFDSAVQLGFSSSQLWFANRDKVYSNGAAGGETPSAVMEKAFGFNLNEFAKAIDDEMMYCKFGDQGELIVIELKEITRAQTQMDKIRRAVKTESESYADRTIYTLQKENVLMPVVLPFDLRSPETSYAFDDDLLLISARTESIKRFIDFREKEQTVGKSIGWSKFLETTLGESNVSLIVNKGNRSPSPVVPGLPGVARIERASVQFYALKGNYYSSTLIQFSEGSGARKAAIPRSEMLTMKLDNKVLRGPWLVRNHAERTNEVVFQDERFRVTCLDQAGKPRWTVNLTAPVNTGVQEIDYLKNGKLQYLFCTPGEMHLIDRLGNYVKGFPRKIDMKDPIWLSVVDYDRNRNYRIVLADKDGSIQIIDKDGHLLPGWQKTVGQELADAPTHYRIAQKDYYVAVTKHGELHLFNRRGEGVAPFPIRLGFTPIGDLFCDGKQISIVSETGMLTKLNAAGKKEIEEPLLKNVPAARFELVASVDREGFIVTRLERGNLAVFDSSGALKFDVVNPLSDRIEFQYYRFRGSKGAVVMRDTEQNLACVIDLSGKMLVSRPMDAVRAPVLDYHAGTGMLTVIIDQADQLGFLKVAL